MNLIGIAITPSLNLTTERRIQEIAATTSGVTMGPINGSNMRTRFQVAVEDGGAGFDFLTEVKEVIEHHTLELIPALDVHR